MSFKLFDVVDEISNEEYNGGGVLSAEEAILADDAYAEALELGHEAEKISAVTDIALNSIDNIEKNISLEEQLLTTPESITSGVAMISMESLISTAKILGLEETVTTLSSEDIEASPVRALEIAIEEEKSIIAKVVDYVKKLFRKLIDGSKKLGVKIVAAFQGFEDKAKKLNKEIGDSIKKGDFKEVKIEDNLVKTIQSKIGGAIYATFNLSIFKNPVEYIEFLSNSKLNSYSPTEFGSVIKGIANKLQDKDNDPDDIKKNIMIGFSTNSKLNNIIHITGSKIFIIDIVTPDNLEKMDRKEAENFLGGLKFKSHITDANNEEVKLGIKKVLAKPQDIQDITARITKLKKSPKEFINSVDKEIENSQKGIDKLAKDDSVYMKSVITYSAKFVSLVAIPRMISYGKNINGMLSVCAAIYKANK